MSHYRVLLTGGIALIALAGALYGALRLSYGDRSAVVHVRWAPPVDLAAQKIVERSYGLTEGEFREQRTWAYYLTDVSSENIRRLIRHPAVEDTHYIDRNAFQLAEDAARGPYTTNRPAWVATIVEFLINASVLAGVVALVVGAFKAWQDLRPAPAPPAAAQGHGANTRLPE